MVRAVLLACALCLPAAAEGAGRRYAVDPAASTVTIRVGRAGLFKFAGHEHEVAAPALAGEIVADAEDLVASSVTLRFEAAALRVRGKGEPADDVPKVQEAMAGAKVLDVARFPSIAFRSTRVTGKTAPRGAWELEVAGDFSLHGVIRSLALPVHVTVEGDALTAAGSLVVRQTDFGIRPVSVAGVVKVKDEVGIEFRIVGRSVP